MPPDESSPPFPPRRSSVHVDLGSIDAMFATFISEQRHLAKDMKEKFQDLQEKFDARLDDQDKDLDAILLQATKTNGRVTVLEKFREGITSKLAGFILCLSLIGGLASWLINLALDYFKSR